MEAKQRTGRPPDGIPLKWMRGPARYDQGWIVLDRERAEEYTLELEPALPYDLAVSGSPDDAVAFVQQYGLLRHGPESEECRENLNEWDQEAYSMRSVIFTYHLLQRALRGEKEAIGLLLHHFAEELPGGWQPEDPSLVSDLSLYTSKWVAHEVGKKLATTRMGFSVESEGDQALPGKFAHVVYLPNLLTSAYYEFSLAIVKDTPLAVCAECGRVFERQDARQRYHSPKCASRARFRRWQEKKRSEEDAS